MSESNLDKLTINYLTEAQYETAKEAGEINENELYCTPDDETSNEIAISPTEPTTGEKVWMQKGKNLLNLLSCKITNNFVNSTISKNDLSVVCSGGWAFAQIDDFEVVVGKEYVLSTNYTNNMNINNGIIIYDSNGGTLNFQTSTETSGRFEINFIPTTEKIMIKFAANNTADINTNTVNYSNIQLKQDSTAKPYEPYIDKKIWCKNDNGVYEEFYKKPVEKIGYVKDKLEGAVFTKEKITQKDNVVFMELQLDFTNAPHDFTVWQASIGKLAGVDLPSTWFFYSCMWGPGIYGGAAVGRMGIDPGTGDIYIDDDNDTGCKYAYINITYVV